MEDAVKLPGSSIRCPPNETDITWPMTMLQCEEQEARLSSTYKMFDTTVVCLLKIEAIISLLHLAI